ncbi:SKA complex subunit 1-like [Mytilus galloprovincialis]|uniref:SKA complex subunit 1-like n=1 Tax=Mytilus galloprovincialis TaxID=29158 RepID=UPI003F7C0264
MATLEDLAESFDGRLECIRTLVDLQFAAEEIDCNKHFETLLNEVEKLENVLSVMRSVVQKQKEESKQIQEVKLTFENMISHLQYSCQHVPVHIPQPAKKEAVHQEAKTKKENQKTSVKSGNGSNKGKSAEKNEKNSKKSGKCDVYVPTVEYVTVEEFEGVPKYMKGRLSYSQVNGAIDELNKPLKEKYKILSMKRTTLNDINRKRYEKFKLQETKDTAGEYFIVEEDIKEFSTLKIDNVGRAILTILRHCGRMKEIRGSGHIRYACLPVY